MFEYNKDEAVRYDSVINQLVYKFYVNKKIGIIEKWIDKTDSLLDVGCGTGEYTLRIGKMCKKIIGIDNSKEMIRIAKNKAKKTKMNNISFIVSVLQHLPFKDQEFNSSIAVNLIHHLIDEEKIKNGIQEKNRVVKNGGHLLIFDLNSESIGWSNKLIPRIIRAVLFTILFPIHEEVLDNIEEGTKIVNVAEILKKNHKNKVIYQSIGGFIPTYCPKVLFRVFVMFEKILESTPIISRYGAHTFVVGEVERK